VGRAADGRQLHYRGPQQDQNEQDFENFVQAFRSGRLEETEGI
jgi:hypothetical protein